MDLESTTPVSVSSHQRTETDPDVNSTSSLWIQISEHIGPKAGHALPGPRGKETLEYGQCFGTDVMLNALCVGARH